MKNFSIVVLITIFFLGCSSSTIQETTVSYNSDVKKNEAVKTDENRLNDQSINEEIILKDTKNVVKNIALVYAAKSIGKYSIEATNTAMSYLINKNLKFNLEVIDIEVSNKESIHNVLERLEEKGIKDIIFLTTSDNIDSINDYTNIEFFNLYLPLINKSDTDKVFHPNIVFGGIDYSEQFESLSDEFGNNLIEIYDDSRIGLLLHKEFKLKYPHGESIRISGKNPRYKRIFEGNKNLGNSIVLLNMPIIKSSIVLSQLRAHDINVVKALSTQINFSPLLFVLTQKEDRENFYVINAIEKLPSEIEELNLLFENDILYNWVNFSTILGLEYLLSNEMKLFDKINIIDNQVEYNFNIFHTDENKFTHYKSVK